MAELIGVIASVVGIVAAAGKVAELLSNAVPGLTKLQSNAAALLSETESTKIVLGSLQRLLEDLDGVAIERRDMVLIDQIVTLLTTGVLLFSELENLVSKLGLPRKGLRSRTRWGQHEKELGNFYQRLSSFKSNITILLNVLQWQAAGICREI